MNIINKYILKHYLASFFGILVILLLVIWLTQSLRFIDLIANKSVDISVFSSLTLNLIIPMSFVVMPLATLAATLITANNLYQSRELTIMKASGMSKFQVSKPLILAGIFTVIFHLMISSYFMPNSYKKFRDIQFDLRDSLINTLFEEGVFNTQNIGITIYVREKISDTHFKGILIYDSRKSDKPVTIIAEEAYIKIDDDTDSKFMLFNGSHQTESKNKNLTVAHFDSYSFSLQSEDNPENQIRYRHPNEMFIDELLFPDALNDRDFQVKTVHGSQRLLWPFYNLILITTVLGIFFKGEFTRRNIWKKLLVTTVLNAALCLAFLSSSNFAMKKHSFVYFMFIISFFALILGVSLLFEKNLDHKDKI